MRQFYRSHRSRIGIPELAEKSKNRLLRVSLSTQLDFVHCHRSPDGTFDGCNVAAKGPFHRYATVLTLQCNVNYLEPGDGILSFARCRTEMKKCSHPCFGGVLCTYGGSRMDKVEVRMCEKIGTTVLGHYKQFARRGRARPTHFQTCALLPQASGPSARRSVARFLQIAHARIGRITSPATSVRRISRPPKRYVSRV